MHLRMAFEGDMRSRRESLETDGYNCYYNNFHIEGEELCDVDDDKVLIEAGNKFDFEWDLPCSKLDFQANNSSVSFSVKDVVVEDEFRKHDSSSCYLQREDTFHNLYHEVHIVKVVVDNSPLNYPLKVLLLYILLDFSIQNC